MDFFGLFKRSHRTPTAAEPPQGRLADRPVLRVDLPPPPTLPGSGSPCTPQPVPELSADRVRKLLFDAVAAGDERKLDALCREHHSLIVERRAAWLDVPTEIRGNAELAAWYANGLRAISDYCAETLKRAEFAEARVS